VSEGLPLAMGEAALMGVPIICTDVGASFRVVVDKDQQRISKLVAPNDAMSLARAQIGVLALLDEWAAHAEDPEGYHPTLPLRPTPEETKQITKRMYEKQEQRRKLGMRSRDNILNSFSGDRYLREHEQMLWIGKHQSTSYRATLGDYSSASSWTDEEWGKPFQ
jgi:glycosyltransferase involved in cell wall biosynthesis